MSEIATIFALDPNKCSKQDIQKIVTYFRERRAQFKAGSLTAGSTKASKLSAKDAESVAVVRGLDLKDLL